jgi:hypothetical protein
MCKGNDKGKVKLKLNIRVNEMVKTKVIWI